MHLRASKLTPLVLTIASRASLQDQPTQFCAFTTIAVGIFIYIYKFAVPSECPNCQLFRELCRAVPLLLVVATKPQLYICYCNTN